MLTVVTPAYNESRNLPVLFERLKAVLDDPALAMDWEWLVIDDHSSDGSYELLKELGKQDARVKCIRFSRNFGSHPAISCGLRNAKGDCVILLMSDLQDPTELIPQLIAKWREGAKVVWAVRMNREGENFSTLLFSKLYYKVTSKVAGLKNRPTTGVDYCLFDRDVLEAYKQMNESHVSTISLIAWLGFSQAMVPYDKKPRLQGKSHWTFNKKVNLALDTITAFTSAPIRYMSYAGFTAAALGFLLALVVFIRALFGTPPEGYPSLMVVVLVMGGLQMIMMGILGEYLWRALDESRRRPYYIIEAMSGVEKPSSLPEEEK